MKSATHLTVSPKLVAKPKGIANLHENCLSSSVLLSLCLTKDLVSTICPGERLQRTFLRDILVLQG